MAEVIWTDEQMAALSNPVADTLVSAAAGSGKTQVLTERIVRRLCDDEHPVDIDRLLIVTFTRAAAGEMRLRISKAISKKLREDGENDRLKLQLSLLPGAKISTITSFCIDLVRKNFYNEKVALPPDFRVGAASETNLLSGEALGEVLDEMYAEGEAGFLTLAKNLSNRRGDGELCETIRKIYDFINALPYPDEWLDRAERMYFDTKNTAESVRRVLLEEARVQVESAIEAMNVASGVAADNGEIYYDETISLEIARLYSALTAKDYDTFFGLLDNIFEPRLSGKGGPSEAKEQCKALRKNAKDSIKAAKKFYVDIDDFDRMLGEMSDQVHYLLEAVRRFSARFAEKKREKKLIDFADGEHFALKILENDDHTPTVEARELGSAFDEIYIDEYQDTNRLQDRIFELVSGLYTSRPNRFMVGDMKQSIYRFRRSDPSLFIDKYDSFLTDDGALQKRIDLSKNFRSREPVIDAVNAVFSGIMTEESCKIDYDKTSRLECGALYGETGADYCAQLLVCGYEKGGELTALENEMTVVAKRINEMINSGFPVTDPKSGETRPIRYSDIVILARSVKNFAPIAQEVLKKYSIASYCDHGNGLVDAPEIRTLMAALEVIDNAQCDIPLAALMRSPMFGFSEDELVKIRLFDRELPFYMAVKKCEAEGGAQEKLDAFRQRIGAWRRIRNLVSVETLCRRVLDDTGFYAFVGAQEGGAAKQANLRLLLDKALEFEAAGYRGLFRFIKYIEALATSQSDNAPAKEVSENFNAVRIMTIHKSKGLEFPVVFLVNSDKSLNKTGNKGSRAVLSDEAGIGLPYCEEGRRIVRDTPLLRAIKALERREYYGEEMRVLYVALTRAKEKLIVTGAVEKPDERIGKWENYSMYEDKLPCSVLFSNASFLDWIGIIAANGGSAYWRIKACAENEDVKTQDEDTAPVLETLAPSDEIMRRLSYKYPGYALTRIPAKVSVSELKRRAYDGMDEEDAWRPFEFKAKTPRFMTPEREMTAAERGSAMHAFMQFVDFKNDDLSSQLEKLVKENIMTKKETDAVDLDRIRGFMSSPLGVRMKNAKYIRREEPFNIAIDSSEVDEAAIGGSVYLQGVIDCYFEDEDGKIVLLDYKTDRTDDDEKIRKLYSKQLFYYEKALFKKFFKKIDAKFIYMFYNGHIIEF